MLRLDHCANAICNRRRARRAAKKEAGGGDATGLVGITDAAAPDHCVREPCTAISALLGALRRAPSVLKFWHRPTTTGWVGSPLSVVVPGPGMGTEPRVAVHAACQVPPVGR